MATLPVTAARHPRRSRAARRRRAADPAGVQPGAVRTVGGSEVHLKCENLQRAGSFKIRGAYTRISRLSDEEKARGVVAAERRQPRPGRRAGRPAAGHRRHGVHARRRADPQADGDPRVRRRRSSSSGATLDESLVARAGVRRATGAVLIHPFDHADIVAGQGTCGLEILEQCPDVGTIVVSTGGGGLLARHRDRGQGRAPRRAGRRRAGRGGRGLPALAARRAPGAARAHGDDGRRDRGRLPGRGAVRARAGARRRRRDGQRGGALPGRSLFLLERAKLVVEPAGAAAVADLLDASSWRSTGPVVAVLSGGNIDPLLLLRIIRHGLAAAGRYLDLARARPGPARLARRAARRPGACRRERRRGRARSAPTPACRSTRSRSRCSWRPKGPRTGKRCCGPCGRAATGWCSAPDATTRAGCSAGERLGLEDGDLDGLAVRSHVADDVAGGLAVDCATQR